MNKIILNSRRLSNEDRLKAEAYFSAREDPLFALWEESNSRMIILGFEPHRSRGRQIDNDDKILTMALAIDSWERELQKIFPKI